MPLHSIEDYHRIRRRNRTIGLVVVGFAVVLLLVMLGERFF